MPVFIVALFTIAKGKPTVCLKDGKQNKTHYTGISESRFIIVST